MDAARKLAALANELREGICAAQPTREQVERQRLQAAATEHGSDRRPSAQLRDISEALQRETEVHHFKQDEPLGLVNELSHHFVLGKYLWLGGADGRAIVLNDEEHALMLSFSRGDPPERVAETAGWHATTRVIGRLATSGFIRGITGYTERRLATPERFARLHLTKACQLQCIHCYADSSPYVDRTGELQTKGWMRIVDDFADIGGERVLFTGGEALIHKGCVPLMGRAKQRGLHVTLFSNGLMIPRFLDQIEETVDQVQVSLDGPDEATNDVIRGKGTFRKIVQAIDMLLARDVRVRVGMSTMEQNWEAWKKDFLTFAKRYAHTPLEFRLGFGLTRVGRAADLSETLDVEETQPIADRLASLANHDTGPTITRTTKGCGYFEQLIVGPDGTVYPCHLLDGPVCHIDSRPLPELIAMLKNLATLFSVDRTEGCNTCDIRYLCGGTCRVMNGNKTGSRLITTCTMADKQRRYRNLVELFQTNQPETAG